MSVLAAVVAALTIVVTPNDASAAPSSIVIGTPSELLATVPVLPKMEVGYGEARWRPRAVPRLGPGPWTIDFGAGSAVNRARVKSVPLFFPKAAWASGAYGWTAVQRAAWSAPRALLSRAVAARVTRQCSGSASLVCSVGAVPDELAPAAAVEVTRAAVRHRLSMTRDEKAFLEPLLDRYEADHPDDRLSVTTTAVPALASTDGSSATGRVVDASLFGLLAPPIWNSAPTVPFTTLRLWDSGVSWKDIEPSPGRFAWRNLDQAVRWAERTGRKVLLVLGPVPAWASADPAAPDESWGRGAAGPFAEGGLASFERYVDAVVARYGDRIWGYETWNEANLQTFWRGTPQEMAVMTQIVHDSVARNGANSQVLSASATTRTEGSIYRFFPAYLRELAARNWPVDGFAVHAYPDADGTPSDVSDLVAQYKAYLAIAQAPDLPIYNTELNYGLAGPGPDLPHRDMTPEQAQGWLSRTFIDAVRLDIEQTHWFAWSPRYYGQYGIQLNPDYDAVRQAWQATYDWLVGSTFIGCTHPEESVLCRFERDGSPFWLAYADRNELVDLPTGSTQWCDLRGACVPTDGGKVVVGVRPIRIS